MPKTVFVFKVPQGHTKSGKEDGFGVSLFGMSSIYFEAATTPLPSTKHQINEKKKEKEKRWPDRDALE